MTRELLTGGRRLLRPANLASPLVTDFLQRRV